MGWDGMVNIGQWSSKSTFGANNDIVFARQEGKHTEMAPLRLLIT